jgi:hypothetical protein
VLARKTKTENQYRILLQQQRRQDAFCRRCCLKKTEKRKLEKCSAAAGNTMTFAKRKGKAAKNADT